MSKNKFKRLPQTVAKAFPQSPAPRKSALPTNADEIPTPPPNMPVMGIDPIRAYDEIKHDIYCARKMKWEFYHQNEDALSIESAIVGQLLNKDVVVVPDPQKKGGQTTRVDRDDARDFQMMLENALGRSGGRPSFVKQHVKAVNACDTGATIPIVWRNGLAMEFGMIDPISTRPY